MPLVTASSAAAAAAVGSFVTGLDLAELPPEVVRKAKANVLYNLACGVAAADTAAAALAWSVARGSGPAEATLLVDGARVHAEQAAFANGVLLHARAQDDTHYRSQAHIGAAVLPAALALAERVGADGAQLLVAVVAGYEVTAAVGEQLAGGAVARGFRASGIFGSLGAAAAAARVLELDAGRTGQAVALAASFAGGLNQTWLDGADEWSLQLGAAARAGVAAAALAAAGARAAEHALEGPQGLAAAVAGVPLAPAEEWELGRRWRTLEVIYKPYPVCNIAQAPVELVVGLARRHDLSPEGVGRVRCFLNPADHAYPGTLGRGPFRGVGGTLMSAAFCVAAALQYRDVSLAALAAHDDPALAAVLERVEVLPDDGLPPLAARVELETADGILADELRPTPDTLAWDWDEVVAFVGRLCAGAGIPCAGLVRAADTLDRAATTDPLVAATLRSKGEKTWP